MNMTGGNGAVDPDFPYAPTGWTRTIAAGVAADQGLTPGENHWDAVRALQEFFSRNNEPGYHARELADALEEKFHSKGGLKFLYGLFPGGPVSQGCLLAGLEPPAGSTDAGFGSVQ